MLCEICHINEATIHMTELVNGHPRQVHLCEMCAKEKGAMKVGIEIPIGMGDEGPELPFSLDDFFQNFVRNVLMNPEFMDEKEEEEVKPSRICKNCGLTIEQYLQNGMSGCKDCYPTFKNAIVTILESYMQTNLIPEKNEQKRELVRKLDEIMRLRDDLEISVAVEDYEGAGIIRDKIQSITEKI